MSKPIEGSEVMCLSTLYCGNGNFIAFNGGDICKILSDTSDGGRLYVDSGIGPRFYLDNNKLKFEDCFKII